MRIFHSPGDLPFKTMFSTDSVHLAPNITPAGHLLAVPEVEAAPLADDIALGGAFQASAGHGLLYLGSTTLAQ